MRTSTRHASARIALTAEGVTLPSGQYVPGDVVLNVTNGVLRGVTVQDRKGRGKALARVTPADARNLRLVFPSGNAVATLTAFTAAV